MASYYFHNGIDKFGPFSLEELRRQPIDRNTSIWKDGMTDWVKAAEVEEVRTLLATVPPLFKKTSLTEKVGVMIGRNLGLTTILLIIGLIAIWVFNRNHVRNTYLPLPPPIVDQERVSPENFLSVAGTYRTNFWQNKWTINGSVNNSASHTNYKDVVIKVNFLSQTNAIIASKQFVIYDYFPYGLKKNFNLEVDKPAAAAMCGLGAVGAKVY